MGTTMGMVVGISVHKTSGDVGTAVGSNEGS